MLLVFLLLQEVAQRLTQCNLEGYTAQRIGSDEYHLSPIIGVTLFNDHGAVIDVITLPYGNLLS